jgi:hypothetical protein
MYFMFGLYLNLTKSSHGLLSFFLHLPLDDNHFGYKHKFQKKCVHVHPPFVML